VVVPVFCIVTFAVKDAPGAKVVETN